MVRKCDMQVASFLQGNIKDGERIRHVVITDLYMRQWTLCGRRVRGDTVIYDCDIGTSVSVRNHVTCNSCYRRYVVKYG